jgi:hypothetical protein
VLYPEEDHHFLGEGAPSVREDAARRIIDWLAAHVRQAPAPLPEEQQEPATQENG